MASTEPAIPVSASVDTPAIESSVSTTRGEAVATGATDVDSIMRKMAEQQNQIAALSQQLETKSQDVKKLSEKQRSEMQHVYNTVISKWVDNLDSSSEKSREEFKTGMQRLAETGQEENGIWQVVMCASNAANRDKENAQKKETEFQALTQNYEELKTRVGGGRFSNEDARVGSKRGAADETPLAGGGANPNNIWDQFSDFMTTSYSNDSFKPTLNFAQNGK
jgi:hypothetical protein